MTGRRPVATRTMSAEISPALPSLTASYDSVSLPPPASLVPVTFCPILNSIPADMNRERWRPRCSFREETTCGENF